MPKLMIRELKKTEYTHRTPEFITVEKHTPFGDDNLGTNEFIILPWGSKDVIIEREATFEEKMAYYYIQLDSVCMTELDCDNCIFYGVCPLSHICSIDTCKDILKDKEVIVK